MKNTMKKMAAMVAVIALVLTAFTAFASGTMNVDGMNLSVSECTGIKVINTEYANVRSLPTTNGRLLKAFTYGTAVEVTGLTSNGWYRIVTTDPATGRQTDAYIAGNLLTAPVQANATRVLSTGAANNTAPAANGGADRNQDWITFTNSAKTSRANHTDNVFKADVKVGFLALRSSAYSSDSNIIGRVFNGQTVNVITYGTQFDYVYVPALNMYGYVNNDYLD